MEMWYYSVIIAAVEKAQVMIGQCPLLLVSKRLVLRSAVYHRSHRLADMGWVCPVAIPTLGAN